MPPGYCVYCFFYNIITLKKEDKSLFENFIYYIIADKPDLTMVIKCHVLMKKQVGVVTILKNYKLFLIKSL